MKIKYSIIIPYYQQPQALSHCLEALLLLSGTVHWEIIVVHHSEEALESIMAKYNMVKWILNKSQPNPYVSRNLGAQEASGSMYCFLDAQCVPRIDWLKRIDEYINTHRMSMVLAGQINVIRPSHLLSDAVHGLIYLNNKKNIDRSYGVPAGHLVIHHSIFHDFGGFRTDILSGSDIIYTQNLIESGIRIHYVHQAIVDYKGFSYDQLKDKMRKYAKGVIEHKNSSMGRMIMGFFPMRLSLFNDNLRYRNMNEYSFLKKLGLWLLIWRLKIYYTINLMREQLLHYFGAFRDMG